MQNIIKCDRCGIEHKIKNENEWRKWKCKCWNEILIPIQKTNILIILPLIIFLIPSIVLIVLLSKNISMIDYIIWYIWIILLFSISNYLLWLSKNISNNKKEICIWLSIISLIIWSILSFRYFLLAALFFIPLWIILYVINIIIVLSISSKK